ncbi:hypothetical protein V5O48_004343 [Marasmius crinis-equi]|uniref:histidine kinase n=1 Tax=Marasmius crinis-equi TaxID=585013 RepID=A0ABR3FR44_9AGAR
MSQRRSKKSSRPSTAPAREPVPLLPSSSATSSSNSSFLSPQPYRSQQMQTLAETDDSSDQSSSRAHSTPSTPNEPPSLSNVPQESPAPPPIAAQPVYRYNYTPYSYDWATFISAYASGRWDPHRTPNPPISSIHPNYGQPVGLGISGVEQYVSSVGSELRRVEGVEDDEASAVLEVHQQRVVDELSTPTASRTSPSSSIDSQSSASKRPRKDAPLIPDPYLAPAQHRTRNSFSSSIIVPTTKNKHTSLHPLPLGSSLSAGSSTVRNGSSSKSQKAKADLFLPLPHRLPILSSDTVSPGATSPSPYSVAIQSNALYPNSPHPEIDSSSASVKKPPTHSASTPAQPSVASTLPTSLRAVTNAPQFTESPQPQQHHPAYTSRLSLPTSNHPSSSTVSPSTPASSSTPQNHLLYHPSTHLSSSTPIAPPKFPQLINAATMRVAGSNVNISPLALPSPEHELTDPMRSVCVTVPGTLPENAGVIEQSVDHLDGSLSEGGGEGVGHPHVSGLITPSSSSSSLTSLHHRRNTSSGFSGSDSFIGEEFGGTSPRDSLDGNTRTVTTPGGTTRRVRLSMEWKKFWEGTKDVDQPIAEVGVIPPSDSDSPVSPDSIVPKFLRRSKSKGKVSSSSSQQMSPPHNSKPLPSRTPPTLAPSFEPTPKKGKRTQTEVITVAAEDYFSRGGEYSASAFTHRRRESDGNSPGIQDVLSSSMVSVAESRNMGSSIAGPSAPTLNGNDFTPSPTTSIDVYDGSISRSPSYSSATTVTPPENRSSTSPSASPSRLHRSRTNPPGPISFSNGDVGVAGSTSNDHKPSIPVPAPMLPSYSYPYPYTHSQVIIHPTGAMTVPVPMYSSSSGPGGPPGGPPGGSAGNKSEDQRLLGPGSPPPPGTISSVASQVGELPSAGPPLPRRVNLTRQTSAPLPTLGTGGFNPFEIGAATGGVMYRFGSHSGTGTSMLPVLPAIGDTPSSMGARDTSGGKMIEQAGESGRLAVDASSTVTSSMLSVGQSQGHAQGPPLGLGIPSSVSIGPGVGVGASVVGVRAAKEEQMFHEIGYLAPPNPPDELERRRALYKFNIWNTGSDLNFDRIAHLAKLVFNTKGVFISLLDGNEQWFKSEWGMKVKNNARIHSLCAHTILQRDDEPMVVLDTWADWRFAKNPHVVGAPHVRFYAGAPLRTQDGYNVGSLAVIDDAPREEFTPRHRHTLKEFAAIAMREMELWRDKIQLRIRDRIQSSMEQFSRECLEIDMEQQSEAERSPGHNRSSQPSPEPKSPAESPELLMPSSMDRVYDRAAKLVQRTLDVEGVIVMDVSHCEVLESMSGEGSVSVVLHHGDPDVQQTTTKSLTAEEYAKLNAFFAKYPDGYISDEGFVPQIFRQFLPSRVQYALTVPIFNIDKRPFALLCAYNASEHTKRFLEGHELSYLRAIGVIILSAVLKRRMILADKAKSLFISNISHELRTPLHGILAAAELLSDSDLNHAQVSFLQTVQACGTSLVETVNHVLDFTKLSGNSKSGGVENVIVPTKVDLMQLVEDAVDGCWIGHRARTAIMEDTGIGSVYSPPKEDNPSSATRRKHVETVIDIGDAKDDWLLKCEKGGIRRVLMNVFGNSLKFTSDGFVHVILRQLPPSDSDIPGKVKVELSVVDSGKGISQNFLKNQLFHPFSQENPLQTGTGLGLAIVNSIVTSESVGGKVDVWSEEGVGTEIKVTFHAETPEDCEDSATSSNVGRFKFDDPYHPPTVSLVGFDDDHRGVQLLRSVLQNYLVSWWGFDIRPAKAGYGEIVILNEDVEPVIEATQRRDTSRPFIVLSASRGSPSIMSVVSEHELIGGFCRVVYKPGGPSRIRSVLKLCLHALKISSGCNTQGNTPALAGLNENDQVTLQSFAPDGPLSAVANIPPRRNSSEEAIRMHRRPSMSPRSMTIHPSSSTSWAGSVSSLQEAEETLDPDTVEPTIAVGSGGSLLKSSVGTIQGKEHKVKILVVEDNSILRNLLVKWLKSKGYDFRHAVDGRDGVNVYSTEGPFDVVLLDLSMPILDGIGATAEIRQFETQASEARHSRIVALTGMSSLEDKRRAFEAGVDGYLVKPVAFKTLDEMLHKLGIA